MKVGDKVKVVSDIPQRGKIGLVVQGEPHFWTGWVPVRFEHNYYLWGRPGEHFVVRFPPCDLAPAAEVSP